MVSRRDWRLDRAGTAGSGSGPPGMSLCSRGFPRRWRARRTWSRCAGSRRRTRRACWTGMLSWRSLPGSAWILTVPRTRGGGPGRGGASRRCVDVRAAPASRGGRAGADRVVLHYRPAGRPGHPREAFTGVLLEQPAALLGQSLPAVLPAARREACLLDLLSQAAVARQEAGRRLVVDGLGGRILRHRNQHPLCPYPGRDRALGRLRHSIDIFLTCR